jgi:hypothetical protein
MGYQVIFKYHPKKEDGQYDKEETKELKKKVGEPFDDTPLEKLASVVMGQLARRDVWVVDVEAFELKKHSISFKETKGGIVLKNKKFIFGEVPTEGIAVQEEVPHQPQHLNGNGLGVQPHNNIMPQVSSMQNLESPAAPQKRVVKWVSFDAEGITVDHEGNRVPIMMMTKKLGLQLSPGRRYPVFLETDDPRDKRVDKFGNPTLDRKRVYQIWDDRKREVTVSQDYFLPAETRLGFDELGFSEKGESGPKLMFEGGVDESMPDLSAMRKR